MSHVSNSEYPTKSEFYNMDTVNQMIPSLESTFLRIRQLNTQVKDTLHDLGCDEEDFDMDNLDLEKVMISTDKSLYDLLTDLKLLLKGIQKSVLEITKAGCSIKNLEKGHVEWLSKIDGQVVRLSWQIGEKAATLMHDDIYSTIQSKITDNTSDFTDSASEE